MKNNITNKSKKYTNTRTIRKTYKKTKKMIS